MECDGLNVKVFKLDDNKTEFTHVNGQMYTLKAAYAL